MAPLQVDNYPEALQTLHGYCVGSFTPKGQRQLRVKDLPKVYMAVRAGFEPATIRMKGDETTNEPKRPTTYYITYGRRTKAFPVYICMFKSCRL